MVFCSKFSALQAQAEAKEALMAGCPQAIQ
jgi:hypothetical protein